VIRLWSWSGVPDKMKKVVQPSIQMKLWTMERVTGRWNNLLWSQNLLCDYSCEMSAVDHAICWLSCVQCSLQFMKCYKKSGTLCTWYRTPQYTSTLSNDLMQNEEHNVTSEEEESLLGVEGVQLRALLNVRQMFTSQIVCLVLLGENAMRRCRMLIFCHHR
jgi:hypothetical protein